MRFDTIAVRGEYDSVSALSNQGSICEPAFLSPAQHFETSEDMRRTLSGETDGWVYTRIDNPTVRQLEMTLSSLESYGGSFRATATVFSSGMAAIFMAANALVAADPNRGTPNIVLPSACYGGSFNLFRERFEQDRGIELRWVENSLDITQWEQKIDENTRFALCEIPSNPLLRMADIPRVAEITAFHQVPLIVDATVATPAVLRPLTMGADIVVHSVSKSMSASGLSIAGAIISKPNIKVRHIRHDMASDFAGFLKKGPQRDMGVVLSPFNALQTIVDLRGLRSRTASMGRSAMHIASFLSEHPRIKEVFYPGLEHSPGHEVAKRDMFLVDSELESGRPENCYGYLMSIRPHGGPIAARKFLDELKIIWRANDLGRVKSTATIPAISTHSQLSEDDLNLSQIPADLVRISIGCEHVDDILYDIDSALQGARV